MSAPFFLVPALPTGDEWVLDGPEGHHAATVTRLRAGETLVLSDGQGGTARGVVTAVGRGTLHVTLTARAFAPAPDPRLVVLQGLPKGERGDLAVQAMTEVGVDAIVPWAAARCVTRWQGERGERARQRWATIVREAAKQSRRCWLPSVAPLATRPPSVTFVLHESAGTRLSTVELPALGEITLAVGPEGGIADEELAAFEAAGAVPVRLGDTVLRTSTAGAAALAVLSARLGRW